MKNYTFFPDAALTSSLFGIYHSGCLSSQLFVIYGAALYHKLKNFCPFRGFRKSFSLKTLQVNGTANRSVKLQGTEISLAFAQHRSVFVFSCKGFCAQKFIIEGDVTDDALTISVGHLFQKGVLRTLNTCWLRRA